MERIPLVTAESDHPILKPLFDAIRARGGRPFNIHRTPAHAPEILSAFLGLAFALRTKAASPRADRELAILRACQLNRGDYELAHHRGMATAAGLTNQQLNDLAHWRSSSAFDSKQRVILAYVDAMFANEDVSDQLFRAIHTSFEPREIVEITLTAAFYAGVARFSSALRLPLDPDAGESSYGRTN